jgi:radical SAM superfamily enzyme YgiQ (UPF0313 family)
MNKLLLINPVGRRTGTLLSRFSTFPPLSLAYVAASTPTHWEVKIVDENFGVFDYEEADLIGITAFTSNVNRAYEIAKMYRKSKTKVIFGGIHASMLPDEALQFADSVVVGEAEEIWEKAIDDFENNSLSSKYFGPRVDLQQTTIMPRHDLLHPNYLWHSIQTSRGCPFNCTFCSVSKYLGKEYRQRSADHVLEELEEARGKYIFFIDDNLIGYSADNKRRAEALFKGMVQRNLSKKWWMQASMNAADDERIVELAAKAGCMYVFIGFETISTVTLEGMKKGVNLRKGVDNYNKVVEVFHKYGIGVLGAFVIGNDFESASYYKELAKFLRHSSIDIIQITILTPLPGTILMEELAKDGRLINNNFPEDWDKYRFSYVVHQPIGVEPDTIYIGNNHIKNEIFSPFSLYFRTIKSLISMKNITNTYASYRANKAYKKGWQNSHYYKKYPKSVMS